MNSLMSKWTIYHDVVTLHFRFLGCQLLALQLQTKHKQDKKRKTKKKTMSRYERCASEC